MPEMWPWTMEGSPCCVCFLFAQGFWWARGDDGEGRRKRGGREDFAGTSDIGGIARTVDDRRCINWVALNFGISCDSSRKAEKRSI